MSARCSTFVCVSGSPRQILTCPCASTQGVPSLIFHLSDRGGGDLNIVGPPGTDAYMASIRSFVNRRHPAQHIFEVSPSGGKIDDTDSDFSYSTSQHDPAPFAWAQAKTPGAGLEIVALPFSAVLSCAGRVGNRSGEGKGAGDGRVDENMRHSKKARTQEGVDAQAAAQRSTRAGYTFAFVGSRAGWVGWGERVWVDAWVCVTCLNVEEIT